MAWDTDPAKSVLTNALEGRYPFVWLFEIEIPTDPPTRARLAAHDESVTFGKTSSGADIVYTSYPFQVSSIGEDSEGSLPRITVSVANQPREVQALIEEYDGLIGQECILRVVNVAALEAGAFLTYRGELITLNSGVEAATLEIGSYSLRSSYLPSQRALRDFCRFKYRSNRCGYTGALPSCDKTLNGANGCVAHDNQDRIGAFPSLPATGGTS